MPQVLPSWHATPTRQAILDFVAAVTEENNPNYVSPAERIAVFDNDGTLWCEKPLYIQFDYLLRKMAAQAEHEPDLRSQQPWKAAWEKDLDWLGAAVTKHYQGDDSDLQVVIKGILNLAEGLAVEQLEADARHFIQNTRHPTLGLSYQDSIYQPMLDLLQYLEANGFINYIVSGGGRDFMRGFTQELYGIPRERVIGSTLAYRYVVDDAGTDSIVQRAELDVVDDGPGKPIQIWNIIGRRPILAAGNSNGDLQMLTFAGGSSLPALRLLVVHDDADREFDYVAGAEKILSAAQAKSWTSISIKKDWRKVFPV
jgi:phosphoglycolate phosphatase-like HAD superfamily hydrolase